MKRIMNDKIDKTPTSIMKGFLFIYYSNISDKQAHEKLNEQLKAFVAKFIQRISEEGYIIHEKRLVLIDKFEQSYVDRT